MSVYQTIFFDLDGTLIDPGRGIAKSLQYALEKIGLVSPPPAALAEYIGMPLQDIFSALMAGEEVASDTGLAVELYRERYAAEGLYENDSYPGVEEMLRQLMLKGCRLFVATTKPHVFASAILEHLGWAAYFDRIFGSELDGTRSDKGLLLRYVLENNAIRQPALMVGDRKFDAIAAAKNGMNSLGVTYGYGSAKELIEAGVCHLCHSPMDVYHWIHDEKL